MAYSNDDWLKVFEPLCTVYGDKAKACQVLVRKLLDYMQASAVAGHPVCPNTADGIKDYGDGVFAHISMRHPEVRPDVFHRMFKDVKDMDLTA